MEFGALICKPKEPNCSICPVNKICKFFKSGKNLKLTETIKTNKKVITFSVTLIKRNKSD